jgi:hypothetical protein
VSLNNEYVEHFKVGLREFRVALIYGEGWKLTDEITHLEIRSSAHNGLYITKRSAKEAAQELVKRLYDKEK